MGKVSVVGAGAGSWPASSSSRMESTRVPRSAESSSRRCSSGMRLRRSSPSRWRTKGIARPSARIVALRSSAVADDRDPDGGVAQVGRDVDVGDGHEPDARILDLARDDAR